MSGWLLDPYGKINEIFENCQKTKKDWVAALDNFFAEEGSKAFDELPWLNEIPLHHFQPNQVVHFRGMIQDMYDPELYMETCIIRNSNGSEIQKLGRYLDFISCSPTEEVLLNSTHSETRDRKSYLCTSIPGENEWVKEVYRQQNASWKKHFLEKSGGSNLKRRISDADEDDTDVCMDRQSPEEGNNIELKKFKEKNPINLGSSSSSCSKTLKFPIPDEEGIACLLKVYDDKVNLRLNDIVEVVGILSMNPPLPSSEDRDNHIFMSEEIRDRDLPSSLAPRLHVIQLRKKNHCNPLLPTVIERENFSTCSLNIRDLLGSVLETALLGDGLASEYLMCQLISSVYSRQDILPIGKFCLNLFGISLELQEKNYAKHLYDLIQTLSTHSYLFQMTLENMTNMDFTPTKDYEENCLKTGLLQLPPNFQLIIDETKLTAGKLDGKAVKNLTALGNLVRWQKVDYDFQFHSIEQHTDVPVLILSEGKAMINSDYHIRFRPKHTDVQLAFSQVYDLLTPHVLEQLRSHITLARLAPYTMTENMQKCVQDDFVTSRERQEKITADDLHNLLTLARLLAQSCGRPELTQDVWKSARVMELERKRRMID